VQSDNIKAYLDGEISYSGFGAFIFPEPVTLSDDSGTLRNLEELNLDPSPRSRQVALTHEINGKPIIVSDDGFVGVFMPEEEAKSFLNTILATLLTRGIQGQFLQDNDLCGFKWYPDRNQIWLDRISIPSERLLFSLIRDDQNYHLYDLWTKYPRRVLNKDTCKQVLERAFEYTTKPELNKDLILVFEGYTLLFSNANRGAFLYGWMIIETFLEKLWEEYVDSLKDRTRNEKDTLKDYRSWTSHHHIEMFALVGIIQDMTVRNLFNKLRKKRNDIVHKREDVTAEESAGCLRIAMLIILNRLRNEKNPFLELENTQLVELWDCRHVGGQSVIEDD